MENQIVIKPSFDTKSIFRASLIMGPGKRLGLYIGILFVVVLFNTYNTNDTSNPYFWIILFLALVLLVGMVIFRIYRESKKVITDNPKVKEDITYTLNSEYFHEKGESFEIKYFWKDVFKIEEKKDFFLIYIRKNVAKIIKKTDLKDNQYNEIKVLLNSLHINKSLK